MKAKYWQLTPDQTRIECTLCPRHCRLKPGQHGFCFIRQNINQELIALSYGKMSSIAVDPIEKKPLNHFFPNSRVLSFGTIGCNLACRFCQNFHISKAKNMELLTETMTPAEVPLLAQANDCLSVAFTYNEPSIFAEFAIDTMEECQKKNIYTVGVTSGYIEGQARIDFFKNMSATNIDLKSFSKSFYKKYCGIHIEPILETIAYVHHETKTWLELTTLLIPGLNDSDAEIHALSEWVMTTLGPDVPLHFSAFTPHYRMTGIPQTPAETLKKARSIAMSKGLRYVYLGNILEPDAQTTYCPTCQKPLITRTWHSVIHSDMEHGTCKFCKTHIPGRFYA